MKAAIPTSKLTRGLLHCCVETIGLAVFLQQEHRVQQAQGAFAPVQHFQHAAHFLFRSCIAILSQDLLHNSYLSPFIASSGRRLQAGPDTQAAFTKQNKTFTFSLRPAGCAEIVGRYDKQYKYKNFARYKSFSMSGWCQMALSLPIVFISYLQ